MALDKNIKKFIDIHRDKVEIYIETGFKEGKSLRRILNYDINKYYLYS